MALFKRKNDTPSYEQPPAQSSASAETELPAEPRVERLYPIRESEALVAAVNGLDRYWQGFLNECGEKGMDAETIAAAIPDAVEAGRLPAVVSGLHRRSNSCKLFFVHGRLPEGFAQVTRYEYDGRFSISFDSAIRANVLPFAPDADNPNASYLEQYDVPGPATPGVIPDDGDDHALAARLKATRDRLTKLLPLTD